MVASSKWMQIAASGAMTSGIACISVGVADMERAETLWINKFGLEVLARRDGPDLGLSQLWGIDSNAITKQLLIGTPKQVTGKIHFGRIREPEICNSWYC